MLFQVDFKQVTLGLRTLVLFEVLYETSHQNLDINVRNAVNFVHARFRYYARAVNIFSTFEVDVYCRLSKNRRENCNSVKVVV